MKVDLTDKNSETITKYFRADVDDEIFLSGGIKFNYFVYCQDTHIKLNFITTGDNTKGNVFVLLYGKGNNISDISARINHSYCDINLFVFSFLQDNNSVSIDGDVILSPEIHDSKGNLSEKNIVLGSYVKVKATPRLDVYAPDVQATHGVSIDKIGGESLMYLQSRGLSYKNSVKLVVNGYISNILDYFQGTSAAKKDYISQSILTDIKLLND